MPNWCENKLTIIGLNDEMLSHLLSKNPEDDKFYLDFERLIKRPESLDIICGGFGDRSKKLLSLPSDQIIDKKFIDHWFHQSMQEKYYEKLIAFIGLPVSQFIDSLVANKQLQSDLSLDLELGQRYLENLKLFGSETWYEWNIQNWGTKWNASTVGLTIDKESLVCFFDTAWAPPVSWFRSLCQHYPTIEMKLEYFEPGCYFAGELVNNEGEIDDLSCDNDESVKELAAKVFDYIDEEE